MMTREERDLLREKAKAATPGPWERGDPDDDPTQWDAAIWGPMRVDGSRVAVVDDAKKHEHGAGNADFIAAAHPGVVLRLLDALDEVGKQRDDHDKLRRALRGVLDWLATGVVDCDCSARNCDCGTDDYANAAPCALCVARRVLS